MTVTGRGLENTGYPEVPGGPYDYETDEFVWKVQQINNMAVPIDIKALMFYILHLKLTRETFLWLCDNNIPVPMGLNVFRPWIITKTSSFLVMQGGWPLGFTAMGEADTMFGDDVAIKAHDMHFTFTSASVVKQPRAICWVDDAWVMEVHSGGNTKVMSESFITQFQGVQYRPSKIKDSERPSIFALFTTYRNDNIGDLIDCRGSFGASDVKANRRHFVTTKSNLAMFNFNMHETVQHPFHFNDTDTNTVCFQGHQKCYNPVTKAMDRVVLGRGHFGANVYASMRSVWTMKNDNDGILQNCNHYRFMTSDD